MALGDRKGARRPCLHGLSRQHAARAERDLATVVGRTAFHFRDWRQEDRALWPGIVERDTTCRRGPPMKGMRAMVDPHCHPMRTSFRLSRREVLGLGAGAAVVALHPAWAADAAAPLPLITKAIPSTGEKLPAVGLGTDKFRD